MRAWRIRSRRTAQISCRRSAVGQLCKTHGMEAGKTCQVMRYRLRACLHMLSRGQWLIYANWEGSSCRNLLAELNGVGTSRMLEKVEVATFLTRFLVDWV